ncbi:MAG: YitT family protein [Lachnospiraceae bacterium]
MSISYSQNRWVKIALIILGSAIYAAGINFFIVPLSLYSSGLVGIAQLLNLLINHLIPGDITVNAYGPIYFLINVPLLILAWKQMGKNFFLKTIIGIAAMSFFMAVLPVPRTPIVQDYLTSVVIGGILAGYGSGVVLTAGGSGGGTDVLGVWVTKKFKDFSVGKLTLYVNLVVYSIYLILFDIQIVIYSLIYMVFYMLFLDRGHYQNVTVRLMIFTKKEGIDQSILQQLGRGVTRWEGTGVYTNENTHVLVTVVNKYEVHKYLEIVHEIDPTAFTIVDEGVRVHGNFIKRL